jgi:fatty-acyl-CoA synthase
MHNLAIQRTHSAHDAPLSIRHILARGVAEGARAGDRLRRPHALHVRHACRALSSRLASALSMLGVKPGSTVAVMDWDSHRYLECFFAVPMMGAVLHTVNVRISPEQILYTINHAADDVILVNAEFLPILEAIHDKIRPV